MPVHNTLWYQEAGTGQPVLFVHGWCMSSAVWGLQQQAVADGHRFIALDLRGHGRSGVPDDGLHGFAGYAQDLVQLVEGLDLKNLVVVGWSLGAQALLKAYTAIAPRVSGLVLVGATPRFTAAPHFPYGLPPQQAAGMRLKVRRSLERALAGFQSNLFVAGEILDPATAHQAAALLAGVPMPDQAVALSGLEALMDEELLAEAGRIDCPTLLLHGDQDPICLPAASAWLAEQIAGSRRILFPGTGHAPFISRPEMFNRELIGFIKGLAP